MQRSETHPTPHQSERRQRILLALKQPSTARQLGKPTGLSLDACSRVLQQLATQGLVRCLNAEARQSRVYWLSEDGRRIRERLRTQAGLPELEHGFPEVDWQLYGWVCYRHRAAVIKALTEPLQPAAIKRRARSRDPGLCISANNVRDVIGLLVAKGIVVPVQIRRKAHPRYQLTDTGLRLQTLLNQAEALT